MGAFPLDAARTIIQGEVLKWEVWVEIAGTENLILANSSLYFVGLTHAMKETHWRDLALKAVSSQGPVKMDIAAVHVEELPSGMARAWRE